MSVTHKAGMILGGLAILSPRQQAQPGLPSPTPPLSSRTAAASLTLRMVSCTLGTGNLGREVWKLYSMGLRPDSTFTMVCNKMGRERLI